MKNIKRWISLALAAFVTVGSVMITPVEVQAANYWPDSIETQSPCAIVMEMNTGAILYEKNANEQHYPASITKIMTALLVLESDHPMDEVITFSKEAVYNTEGSGLMRDVDEQMTLEQCLYGMMLESANECAYALAETVGGSYDNFVQMMNDKAAELGCTNTHFNNPHGLPDENHYTCAADMAKIAQAAYANETFRIIIGTRLYEIPPTNKHDEITYCQNHNSMINNYKTSKYLYEYCTGGKTGYTDAANSTLVTYAEKDGLSLVCVVMNTISPAHWTDSINLFNYCFDNFQLFNVADNEKRFDEDDVDTGELNVNESYAKLDETGQIVLPKTAEFNESTPEVTEDGSATDDVLATLQYTFADHVVGRVNIVATGAKVATFQFDNQKETESSTEIESESKTFQINFRIILYVILAIAGILILIYLLKWVYDNFYIIRHRLFGRKNQFKQYKKIKDRRKSVKRRPLFRRKK